MRQYLEFPCVETLTRLTWKVAKADEIAISKSVFSTLEERQKLCVLLHDEVYVKKMMFYHGGQVFGKSTDDPKCLAKTVVGIMICCMFGGPTFLTKILPISPSLMPPSFRVKSSYHWTPLRKLHGGQVKVIVCDGYRTNQAFFCLIVGGTFRDTLEDRWKLVFSLWLCASSQKHSKQLADRARRQASSNSITRAK